MAENKRTCANCARAMVDSNRWHEHFCTAPSGESPHAGRVVDDNNSCVGWKAMDKADRNAQASILRMFLSDAGHFLTSDLRIAIRTAIRELQRDD